MPIRVTWIAPVAEGLEPLGWLSELGRIAQIPGVAVTTLTGESIAINDVATVLAFPADILIWSGHGKGGGLVLSDGEALVRPRWLATQISQSAKPKVTILAACGSQGRDNGLRSLTETICRSGRNAVGFPANTDDKAASTFIVECVRALSVNASVVAAFDVALESIGDSATANGVTLMSGIMDVAFDLDDTLRAIQATQDRILGTLGGQTDLPVAKPGNITPMAHTPAVGHVRGLGKT